MVEYHYITALCPDERFEFNVPEEFEMDYFVLFSQEGMEVNPDDFAEERMEELNYEPETCVREIDLYNNLNPMIASIEWMIDHGEDRYFFDLSNAEHPAAVGMAHATHAMRRGKLLDAMPGEDGSQMYEIEGFPLEMKIPVSEQSLNLLEAYRKEDGRGVTKALADIGIIDEEPPEKAEGKRERKQIQSNYENYKRKLVEEGFLARKGRSNIVITEKGEIIARLLDDVGDVERLLEASGISSI
ncbi:MAG: hypothetical protein ABEJ56_00365 [Candidatus Nanohaloarchaea archaeon]